MSHSPKAAKAEPFEKNLERLDAIVRQLEDADLPLEKALHLYEEGMRTFRGLPAAVAGSRRTGPNSHEKGRGKSCGGTF